MCPETSVSDPHSFFEDLDPGCQSNADPDPGLFITRFWATNYEYFNIFPSFYSTEEDYIPLSSKNTGKYINLFKKRPGPGSAIRDQGVNFFADPCGFVSKVLPVTIVQTSLVSIC
jgi:hypothetical protein